MVKDRRNSGCRSNAEVFTYFRIRVSGSKVVISGKIRASKFASYWLKITEMKAISTQKQHKGEISLWIIKTRASGRARAPHEWIEIRVRNFINLTLVIIGQNPLFGAFVALRGGFRRQVLSHFRKPDSKNPVPIWGDISGKKSGRDSAVLARGTDQIVSGELDEEGSKLPAAVVLNFCWNFYYLDYEGCRVSWLGVLPVFLHRSRFTPISEDQKWMICFCAAVARNRESSWAHHHNIHN